MKRGFRATYRLQLRPGFGFRESRKLVPYLRDLGISHLYLSPIMKARAGSTHGYDVVDPTRVSEQLGGEDEFRALAQCGLGVVLDVVPNHMATSDENRYWRDSELRAKFFDWDPETGWYRRFFTIDDLAGVRQEDPDVFEETHRKALDLVADGLVDALRVDHVDGLAAPAEYLRRLHGRGVEHVWVEKILEPGEQLPAWPVEGTTGYEFANEVTALFVDPRGEEPFTRWYQELTGERRAFAEIAHEAKLEFVRTEYRREVERLSELSGIPFDELAAAVASLDVYRSYPADEDQSEFARRFQQTTAAAMAKGVEDTAFYRYHRLSALNEVGGDPARFSLAVDGFHRANVERAARFPNHLLATQTHDTKRSGDVRARIAALAGLADEWVERRKAWRVLDDPHEDELLWQTLVGTWPIDGERIAAYMEKALREAKVNTNWIAPNEAHERRVGDAVRRVVADPPDGFEELAARVADIGQRNVLGMTLLKLTVPGVPDIYQGDELESLNLVDPDNRRPVDWSARRRALAEPPPKLHVIRETLALRARRELGEYRPLELGTDVCAFLRGDDIAIVVPLRGQAPPELGLAGEWRSVLDRRLPIRLLERV